MNKKIKKVVDNRFFKYACAVLLIVFVSISTYFVIYKITVYDNANEIAGMSQIRELIVLSAHQLKKDAPVDAKTGDIYFPEEHLYLPNPKLHDTLTYRFNSPEVDPEAELSVSTSPILGTQRLYTAQNFDELFLEVPKLQSCSRGIKIVDHLLSDDDTAQYKYSVHLNNGETVNIYQDKQCPELDEITEVFKNLRSY